MPDETEPAATDAAPAGATDPGEADLADEPPDESTLLGATGVETEVLAELARAEAELNDPNAPDDPDEPGAAV